MQITTSKNVNLVSQEDFAKLRPGSSGLKTDIPPPPPTTATPQNTPAVGSMIRPPQVEELEGMDFELESDMERKQEVPMTPENHMTPRRGNLHARRGQTPRFYPVTKESAGPVSQDVPRKRKTRHSKNPPVESHVGWIMDSKAHNRKESISESVGSLGSSCGTPQSLPTFQHPSHSLLKENGFTQLQYSKYHTRCLKGNDVSLIFGVE